ncbi:MAG: hypothetical protein R3E87_09445 [Burkholderiaceae bacterium]
MTRAAVTRGALKDAADVTRLAFDVAMGAREPEARSKMVERFGALRRVAYSAEQRQ